jgi:DNA-binding SARP family transcriptional activator
MSDLDTRDGSSSIPLEVRVASVASVGATRVSLLGTPGLRTHAGTVVLERKDAALLALLALEGATGRARAAALLWPEVDEAGARLNLRQRLHRMRRAAGRDLVEGADTLQLAAGLEHDLGAPAMRLATDLHALKGELLGSLDYADCRGLRDWVEAARESWRRARRQALSAIGASLETQDHVAAALEVAERLAHDEPTLEPAYRSLMRLHLRRGDRAAALAAYERCREALAREQLGRPDEQTRELQLKILRGTADNLAAPGPGPIAVRRPPRLVGRDSGWAALEAAWQQGQVIVLTGEPGVGKSRLLGDFAAAHADCVVVGGRPGDLHNPFALLGRLLRELLPHAGGAAADALPSWVEAQLGQVWPERATASTVSPWNPVRLRAALIEVLRRAAGSVGGVLIDDAQFCDVASLELLTSACLDGDGSRLRWLVAVRANEVPAMLAEWVAQAERERVCEQRLGPLDLAGVVALLESLAIDGFDAAAAAPALLKHTGGNPMFLLETLRALLGPGAAAGQIGAVLPVPQQVGELIAGRLAQLSPQALALAQVAALAEQDFEAALGAAVLDRHALDLADPWRELERAQVIRGNAFAHDLIFEATMRSAPPQRAIEWHGRIAAWLAERAGEPARIAFHWKGAQRWAEAGRAFDAAAARLRSKLRRDEEAALLREANDCHALSGDDEARADALHHLFLADWYRKFRPGIRAASAQLSQLARTPRARMWALYCAAMLAVDENLDTASLALTVEAREHAEKVDDGTDPERPALTLLVWETSTRAMLNQPEEATRLARRTNELLDSLPSERLIGSLSSNTGFAFELCGRLPEALACFDRAERIFEQLDEPVHLADTRCMSTLARYQLGQLGESVTRLEAGRRVRAEMNRGSANPDTTDIFLARWWREAGRFGPALVLSRDTMDGAERMAYPNLKAWAATELAAAFIVLGQSARAGQLLELARAASKAYLRIDGLLVEMQLARALGQSPQRAIDEALSLLPGGLRPERMRWRVDIERVRTQPAVQAAELMRENFRAAMAGRFWSLAAPSWALWIDALRRSGDTRTAAEQARLLARELAGGAPTHERMPLVIYAPEYHLILHRAFDAAGDAAAAQAALRDGVAWIRDTALPHVPEEFRASFLERNEVNRTLLGLARANGLLTPR